MVPLLAMALFTLPGHADAQARGGGGRGGLGQQNQITAVIAAADSLQLNLTADQRTRLTALAAQVDQANAPRLAQIQAAIGGGGGDVAALGEVVQAMQAENTRAMETARTTIFTAAQLPAVNAFVETLGRGGRGGRRGGGAGAPPAGE
jgi:hypothetical protein